MNPIHLKLVELSKELLHYVTFDWQGDKLRRAIECLAYEQEDILKAFEEHQKTVEEEVANG